jgi:hypothetical protein
MAMSEAKRRRVVHMATKGGYRGGLPASEVGPPVKVPSATMKAARRDARSDDKK